MAKKQAGSWEAICYEVIRVFFAVMRLIDEILHVFFFLEHDNQIGKIRIKFCGFAHSMDLEDVGSASKRKIRK